VAIAVLRQALFVVLYNIAVVRWQVGIVLVDVVLRHHCNA
jgi:hypothetical protein